jgi:hypothetical protein
MVDALVLGGEEGRGQLRKATVSRKQAKTRGYPNGETRQGGALAPIPESIGDAESTGRTETSKYPEEKKATAILQVAASERGEAQTSCVYKAATVAHGA